MEAASSGLQQEEPQAQQEPSSSSSTWHDKAVSASRNVPLRRRKRGQAEKAEKEARLKLQSYYSMPDYLQDNEFIQHYYRNPNMPFRKTLLSLFKIHNESGNIWTHLIGFILFVCLTVFLYSSPPTPLSVSGHRAFDSLLMEVTNQLQNVRGNLGRLGNSLHVPTVDDLHSLQGSLTQLGDNLQHRVDELLHGLQGEVSYAAAALRDGLSLLQGGVSGGMHALQDGMHALQDGVHALSDELHQQVAQASHAVTEQLSTALSRVLQWPTPRWPVYVYMAGAMTCLLLSSVCHLLGCCAQHVSQMIWRFDYSGIAILIVASFYPPVYYSLLCQPAWSIFYLAVTTVLGLVTVAVSLCDAFQSREWRPIRAGMFAGLGSFGLVPVLHAMVLYGDVPEVKQALTLDVLMGVLYLAGAVVYAQRVPERWLPGKFDLLLNSHQIFHILIVAAALVHYQAVMLLLAWRDAIGGCAGTDGAASAFAAAAAAAAAAGSGGLSSVVFPTAPLLPTGPEAMLPASSGNITLV